MYQPTTNALTHHTQLVTSQAKKPTVNIVNNDIGANDYFLGTCYYCGNLGHISSDYTLRKQVNQGEDFNHFQGFLRTNASRSRQSPLDFRSRSRSPSRERSPLPY